MTDRGLSTEASPRATPALAAAPVAPRAAPPSAPFTPPSTPFTPPAVLRALLAAPFAPSAVPCAELAAASSVLMMLATSAAIAGICPAERTHCGGVGQGRGEEDCGHGSGRIELGKVWTWVGPHLTWKSVDMGRAALNLEEGKGRGGQCRGVGGAPIEGD
eukprot:357492-Chlamydomonas_euryale.AAC.5